MTSMAFSLGVLPLVLSSGAGSGGRKAIGSGVLSGTIAATVLGVLFVPFFFVMIARMTRGRDAMMRDETAIEN
jgi:HAE1 family hydrophobic/amphiphilic exporter-1/multidrug efflux pump